MARFPAIKEKYITLKPKTKLKVEYQKSDVLLKLETAQEEMLENRRERLIRWNNIRTTKADSDFIGPGPGQYDLLDSNEFGGTVFFINNFKKEEEMKEREEYLRKRGAAFDLKDSFAKGPSVKFFNYVSIPWEDVMTRAQWLQNKITMSNQASFTALNKVYHSFRKMSQEV